MSDMKTPPAPPEADRRLPNADSSAVPTLRPRQPLTWPLVLVAALLAVLAGVLWRGGHPLLLQIGTATLFLFAVLALVTTIAQRLEQQTLLLHSLLERQFAQPVQTLAQNSAEWGQTAQALQEAYRDFLSGREEAQARYEAQMARLFDRHEQALDALLQAMRQDQARFVRQFLDQVQEQLAAAQKAQEAALHSLQTMGIQQFGAEVTRRVEAVESQVSKALQALQERLPEAMRESVGAAVADAVELAEAVREQAGALAQTLDQIGQNADRQMRVYEQWSTRMGDWQTRLEQVLAEGQAAHRETVAVWQERAQQSLARMEEGFAQAADTAKSGHGVLVDALRLVAERVRQLDEVVQSLQTDVNDLRSPLSALDGALAQTRQPLAETAAAITQMNAAAVTLSRALAVVGDAEIKHLQRLDETEAALRELNETFERMRDTADRVINALRRMET